VTGPVILINKFNVKSDEVEQFSNAWEEDAKVQNRNRVYFCTVT
jgi:hypothetical protein